MSTKFTFNSGADSPFQSADDDTKSVATYRDGKVDVDLCTDYITHLNILGTLRYQTGSGLAKSQRHYDSTNQRNIKVSSMAGEGGLHVAYDEWVLDERIIEDGGDGGKDGEMLLGGEMKDVDVKTSSGFSKDPWLKVKAPKYDRFEKRGDAPDAFILATHDDGTVTYHGWISADELCQQENRSMRTGADNYLLTDTSKLNEMPKLPNDFTFSS